MKIVHCADLHLDSRLNANLDEKKAAERRQELLGTWLRLLEYASKHEVSAILISGDMFDTAAVSSTTANAVIASIKRHPEMVFFYLKGNHDTDSFLNRAELLPENLYTFNDSWRMYRLSGNIVISGRELTNSFGGAKLPDNWAARTLNLREEDYNIVMLHGQVVMSRGESEDAEEIHLPDYAGRNVDYMALGHVHRYMDGQLDGRGIWCYPGCLEGRGFDECARHGFVMLDIDEDTHKVKRQLIDISKRHLWTVPVDVTGLENSVDMVERAKAELAVLSGTPASGAELENIDQGFLKEILDNAGSGRLRPDDMVKLVLKGELMIETEKSADFIRSQLRPMFYYIRIEDETRRRIDYRDYENDKSLKGEFIRAVRDDMQLQEDIKPEVIDAGIRLLLGEKIG
ncbi:metallophosphoesterase family protein [Oribacterium sp. WCC10]|uniref:metallophosphoesterase family protein n=1 Tax=Oribacterium sp. WCC10 TaxID=1855343 RepID=UPI0008E4AAF7|nr:DNA repair exonuclease [Oribacterium sp. WCC10]SFG34633.1 DNA repair exonuclease SbcCD nuclease subunit [Oribacterium sp. WCC10]